ncbi:MAG: ligase-associated DNA damage response endonuclease PdeM [Oligoflexus sp.]|nr:ligase-associated DNA damage response endonuclease PdeM [Oligoflexus sp.]
MAKSISTEVRGQELTLYGRKAVYWHEKKTLILADTHWGKAEVFQEHGIPIPSTILNSDLEELAEIVEESGTERILVLGDLMHSPKGIPLSVQETIEQWRTRCSIPIVSIRGNHDPKVSEFPPHWNMSWVSEPYVEGPFCFRHEPGSSEGLYTWCGHIHPVLNLGRPRMRLPCFWLSPSLGVLPSFGFFTGGHAIKPTRHDEVFVISGGEVFSLT